MNEIKLIICDFDGTLADTFEANYLAYERAFECQGLNLDPNSYKQCFGFRFDRFMDAVNIYDPQVREQIRKDKQRFYPEYFDRVKVNHRLMYFIRQFHKSGGKTAVASTAQRANIMPLLEYIKVTDFFDLILAGNDIKHSKPNPEIFIKALDLLNVCKEEALVFEDSAIGCQAAKNADIKYIQIKPAFYED